MLHGDQALNAIQDELKAMIKLNVWEPQCVDEEMMNSIKDTLIRSKMFVKEKYSADGSFEKLKARLPGSWWAYARPQQSAICLQLLR